jgi:hypothetical protein
MNKYGAELAKVEAIIRGVLEGFEDSDGIIREVPTMDLLVELVKALED